MRRAVAIQLIINRELGLNKNPEPLAGLIRDRVPDGPRRRGRLQGVRGHLASAAGCWAPWRPCTSAARSRKRSLYYETKKHDGSLPIVGVNTFLSECRCGRGAQGRPQLIRSTEEEKQDSGRRGARLPGAQRRAARRRALERLQQVAAQRWQRVRRAHGERQGLLAGADLARAVSGGRSVSSQHVRSGSPRAARIASRARSRSCGTACGSPEGAGASAGRISNSILPGPGQPRGGNARRVPRTIAGTNGQPTRVAVTKAPG